MSIVNESLLNVMLTGGTGSPCPADAKIVQLAIPPAVGAVANFLGWNPTQATANEFYPPEMAPTRPKFGLDLASGLSTGAGFAPFSRDGQDRNLLLRRRPVRSVTNVWDNEVAWDNGTAGGDWPDENKLAAGTYWLDFDQTGICWSGKLYRSVGWTRSRPRTVRVQYVYGYTADELLEDFPTLHQALMLSIIFWAGKIKSAGAAFRTGGAAAGRLPSSVSVLDFSVAFGGNAGNQFGMSSGGSSGGVGAGLPDDAIPLLQPYVSLAGRYLTS